MNNEDIKMSFLINYAANYSDISEKVRHVFVPQYKCELCSNYFYCDNYSYDIDTYYERACICNNCNKSIHNFIYIQYFKDKIGGKCCKCGYSHHHELEYHHIEAITKEEAVSSFVKDRSILKIINEIDKCCLLCMNCHRAYHRGVWIAKFKKLDFGYTVVKSTIRYKK